MFSVAQECLKVMVEIVMRSAAPKARGVQLALQEPYVAFSPCPSALQELRGQLPLVELIEALLFSQMLLHRMLISFISGW